MTRSFRHLLAVRFAAVAVGGMGIVVAGTLWFLTRSLDGDLGANLLNVASIQAAALTDQTSGEMHFHEWDLTPAEAASVQELVRYAQVWSGEGASLLRSRYMTNDLPMDPGTLHLAAEGEIMWQDSSFGGVPIRSVFYPLARLGEVHSGHVLQVAAPLEARNALLVRTSMAGFVLVLLIGAGGFFGGQWLADRAVRPVAEIIDEAETVGAGSLQRRIAAHADTQEYERLVQVLNTMLDRIQASFEGQRRFTADASHELRSPLTAMRGELDLALRRDRSAEEYREVLGSAREEVVRMSRIVEGLLMLARSDAGAMEPRLERSDLAGIVADVVSRSSSEATAHVVRVAIDSPGPVRGIFDPDLVAQLVSNVVHNAIRFAGEGGRVLVTTRNEAEHARISVEDSGPGFAAGTDLIFERFWRADASRSHAGRSEGTGLGLAIAKVIAEQHGGSILASNDSSLGGAKVVIRLPTTPPSRAGGTTPPTPALPSE